MVLLTDSSLTLLNLEIVIMRGRLLLNEKIFIDYIFRHNTN
jgi:hypothetical protein